MATTNLTLEETKVAYEELQAAVQTFRDAVHKFTRVYEADEVDLDGMVDDLYESMFGLSCDIGTHFDDDDWNG